MELGKHEALQCLPTITYSGGVGKCRSVSTVGPDWVICRYFCFIFGAHISGVEFVFYQAHMVEGNKTVKQMHDIVSTARHLYFSEIIYYIFQR